jgi:choline-sulfatase
MPRRITAKRRRGTTAARRRARVVSIGKLHFRATEDDNGFTEEISPLHVLDGIGDLIGMLREPPARRGSMPALAESAGAGNSTYNDYDSAIAAAACEWIAAHAQSSASRGTTSRGRCSFRSCGPHFPLTAPPEFYKLYPPERMAMPRLYDAAGRPRHPAIAALKTVMNYDDFFKDEEIVRRAVASYYALVSFLDHNIGQVLAAIERAGLTSSTRVIYSSDHGDNLGCRGLWGKSVMYEESAAIPMIVAGDGVASGAVVETPVSLIDCYRSALEAVGCPLSADDRARPSHSLWEIAAGANPDRTVLSEYHAVASVTGTFMIRHGRWKYIHHVGYRPELFDLVADPGETTDLAERPDMAPVLAACEAALRRVCDPRR